jgi:2-dehydro-3-deoxygalactonokinase
LAARDDVMRGEETQLIGLHALGLIGAGECVVLPGTHSKHVYLDDGVVTGFRSFLTGELFSLLRNHSSLGSALQDKPLPEDESFAAGVRDASAGRWAASLFPLRARALLNTPGAPAGASYLSGLLIGSELVNLAPERPAVVAAGDAVLPAYRQAAALIDLKRCRFLDEAQLTAAFLAGQTAIWRQSA